MSNQVTELQVAMLVKIAEDLHTPLNGEVPDNHEDATTFAEMVIESAQDKGVFTSLMNAGLVWHLKDGKDSTCGLTGKGFEIYKASKAEEEIFEGSTQHNDTMYHVWYEQKSDMAFENGEEFECDTVKVRQAFGKSYLDWMNEILGTSLVYTGMYFPREYNFEEDKVKFTATQSDINLLLTWFGADSSRKIALHERMSEATTSRSGYTAFHTYGELAADKALLVGVMLDVFTSLEYEGSEDFESWYDRNCVYDRLWQEVE